MEINGVKFDLNRDQADALWALKSFLAEPAQRTFGLYGAAGTGKSTVLVRLGETFEFELHKILLTAPTHKATHVLGEMAEKFGVPYDTRTLASALCMKPKMVDGKQVFFQEADWRARSPLQHYTTVVVDECSMVDSKTYQTLLTTADHFGVKIVFTGDHFQLPPVGEESTNGGKSFCFNAQVAHTLTHVERCAGYLFQVVDVARQCIGTGLTPKFSNTNHTRRFKRVDKFAGWFLENMPEAKYVAFRNDMVRKWNQSVHSALYGGNSPPFMPGHEVYAATGSEHWAAHQPFEIVSAKSVTVEGLGAWALELAMTGWGAAAIDEEWMPRHSIHVTVLDPGAWDEYAERAARLKGQALEHQTAARAAVTDAERDKHRGAERNAWRVFFGFTNKFADFRRPHALTVHASQGSTYENVFVNERDIQRCQHSLTKEKLLYVAYSRAAKRLGVI